MIKFALITAIVSAVMYAISFIIACIYCRAGFLGYPDVWSNRTAKKIYFILAPMSTVLVLVAAAMMVAVFH